MRGAARVGGRSFKMPPPQTREGLANLTDLIPESKYLETSPELEPIGGGFYMSNMDDPVDEKDCAAYPASPYCENDFLDLTPIGFRPEVRSNECETCLYIYPIIGFLVLQPTIVCKRDPNCVENRKNPPLNYRSQKPDELDENVQPDEFTSPECAARYSEIHREINRINSLVAAIDEKRYQLTQSKNDYDYLSEEIRVSDDFGGLPFPKNLLIFLNQGDRVTRSGAYRFISGNIHGGGDVNNKFNPNQIVTVSYGGVGYTFLGFRRGKCPNAQTPEPPEIKPPPPPPPYREDRGGNRKGNDKNDRRKRREGDGDDMCCNDCKDSADNTSQLLKEIKEIKKALGSGKLEKALNAAVGIGDDSVTGMVNSLVRRLGVNRYPIEVPESLLTGQGDKIQRLENQAEYLFWLTQQLDALVGEFPIRIDVKDIDPLKAGDQNKTIMLPNIAEAIAEMYGLTLKSSVNQEVELNMLLRLAAEVIATKNGVIVAQDYSRANAQFLGYKGNYKARENLYNFDFGSVNLTDPKNQQPIILEKLLVTQKGYVQGWECEDKETAVGFLQKLMFSAGIIKAVFFRGKNLTKQLNTEASSMAQDEKTQEKDWLNFLQKLNNPNSVYNEKTQDKPEIKEDKRDQK